MLDHHVETLGAGVEGVGEIAHGAQFGGFRDALGQQERNVGGRVDVAGDADAVVHLDVVIVDGDVEAAARGDHETAREAGRLFRTQRFGEVELADGAVRTHGGNAQRHGRAEGEARRQVLGELLARGRRAEAGRERTADGDGVVEGITGADLAVERVTEVVEVIVARSHADIEAFHRRGFEIDIGRIVVAAAFNHRRRAEALEAVGARQRGLDAHEGRRRGTRCGAGHRRTGQGALHQALRGEGADFPRRAVAKAHFEGFTAHFETPGDEQRLGKADFRLGAEVRVEVEFTLHELAHVEIGRRRRAERGVQRVAHEIADLVLPIHQREVILDAPLGALEAGNDAQILVGGFEERHETVVEAGDLVEGQPGGAVDVPQGAALIVEADAVEIGRVQRAARGGGAGAAGDRIMRDGQRRTQVEVVALALPAIVAERIEGGVAGRDLHVDHGAIGAVFRATQAVAGREIGDAAGSGQRRDRRTRHRAVPDILVDEFAGDVEEAAIFTDLGAIEGGDLRVLAVAAIGLAIAGGHFKAGVAAQAEVDHAGDGVRAVLGGSAVTQHFEAADGGTRDLRQVGALGTGIERAGGHLHEGRTVHALAVDENEDLVRRQAAQGGRTHEGRGVTQQVALLVERRHQGLQDGLQLRRRLGLEVIGAEHVDRHGAFQHGAVRPAGAGHDDGGVFLGFGGGSGLIVGGGFGRHGRHGGARQHKRDQRGGELEFDPAGLFVLHCHVSPLVLFRSRLPRPEALPCKTARHPAAAGAGRASIWPLGKGKRPAPSGNTRLHLSTNLIFQTCNARAARVPQTPIIRRFTYAICAPRRLAAGLLLQCYTCSCRSGGKNHAHARFRSATKAAFPSARSARPRRRNRP